MSKLDILNAYLTERLMVAVREILVAVGETMSEYKEETAQTHRENESLRRRLREEGVGANGPRSGVAYPFSLAVSEGQAPIEQEWSTSIREDTELTVSEEERALCEKQRTRQKEEERSGQQFDHTACSKAECFQLSFRTSACSATGSVFTPHCVKQDCDQDSVQPSVDLKIHIVNISEMDSLPTVMSDRIKEEPDGMNSIMSDQPTNPESFELLNPDGNKTRSRSSVSLIRRLPVSESAVQQSKGRLRVLKGKRSHPCPQCGKAFSHASGLKHRLPNRWIHISSKRLVDLLIANAGLQGPYVSSHSK
ncbi:hypothetical protein AAFF_G00366890 [Aldrovandia affinis]|uniref:C2H2-type domain-containing protein n=1 Tax=Aldrovandia affinis TaxID=143900 RepID=A0AAD7SJG9_9TELE|nr:hypothetical protein AAFF_G00366890 [Aldrovandia affinis]